MSHKGTQSSVRLLLLLPLLLLLMFIHSDKMSQKCTVTPRSHTHAAAPQFTRALAAANCACHPPTARTTTACTHPRIQIIIQMINGKPFVHHTHGV
jgi:hypothetical protein